MQCKIQQYPLTQPPKLLTYRHPPTVGYPLDTIYDTVANESFPSIWNLAIAGRVQYGLSTVDTYMIVVAHTLLAIDVPSASTAECNLQLFSAHGGANQIWLAAPAGGGYFWLVNKNSGLCLSTSWSGIRQVRASTNYFPSGWWKLVQV